MVDWARVRAVLAEGKPIEARGLLLEAWRNQRHSLLADLIDALDLRLARSPGVELLLARATPQTYAFSHDWREWFTRDPDEVANRLAIFEDFPDPSATRIVLELLLVAPPQLLIAERLWSVIERVLISLGDVRPLISLSSFVDGRWPPHKTHLAIQSVPHLVSAIERLKALPPEPALAVPVELEIALGVELDTVRATSRAAPLDLAADYAQLQRFADARSAAARELLGDALIEGGDVRGTLLNSDHEEAANLEVECLRTRAAERWLSTASHPVLKLSVRAGLPFAATIGSDMRSVGLRTGPPGRSKYAFAAAWPMWPFIKSVTVSDWDDSLSDTLKLLEAVQELRHVPWSAARAIDLRALEVLHTDAAGVPLAEVVRLSPKLREFVGVCAGEWTLFDNLTTLERLCIAAPATAERVLELATREVAERRLLTEWCEHRLIGRPGSLQIETTVSDDWYTAFEHPEDGGPDVVEQLFAQLDATAEMFRGLANWRFSPGNTDRIEQLKEWVDSRGGP